MTGWHKIQDHWDTERCFHDIKISDRGLEASIKKEMKEPLTVLGKAKVSRETAPRVEWRVKANSKDFSYQSVGVMKLPDEQLHWRTDNAKYSFLKFLYDRYVSINGKTQDMYHLGGRAEFGEEFWIRIDFEKEEVSIKRKDREPVVIAKGEDIGTSTFSLHGVLWNEKQSLEIVHTLPSQSFAALDVLGLEEDEYFIQTYKRVRNEISQGPLKFEKRLALQNLLANEAQFQSIGIKLGEPQQNGLTKEEAIDQMLGLAASPFLSISPPELPECQRAVERREERAVHRLTSLLGEFQSQPPPLRLANFALSIQEVFTKLPLPEGSPPPPSVKEQLLAKTPDLFARIRNYPLRVFKQLSGMDASAENYEALKVALVEALKLAKSTNDAPILDEKEPEEDLTLFNQLDDNDV